MHASAPPPLGPSFRSGGESSTTRDDFSPTSTSFPNPLLEAVDKLKFFLATAPSDFPASLPDTSPEDRALNRFLLPTGDLISCVMWSGLYHITGTDIVRALNFRFLAFGRPVRNAKKFEEGVFSDLRNLKSGMDATLEEPKVNPSAPYIYPWTQSSLDTELTVHPPLLVGVPRATLQAQLYSDAEETEGLLLVLGAP